MGQKNTVEDSGPGHAPSGQEESLRRRIAELEAEVRELQKTDASVDGALPAREALLQEAEKIAHLGSWFLNPATNETKWSDELFRILGYDPAKDAGTAENFFGALHPNDLPRALKVMETLATTGKMVPADYRVVWKDGTIREVHCDGTVVLDEDGKMFRVVGTVLDVTDARRNARFLKEVQSVAMVGSWVWDPATSQLDWSDELRRIFGIPPESAITADTFRSLAHPEDRHKAEDLREAVEGSGLYEPVEMRIYHADGSLRHILLQVKRLDGEAGAAPLILGTVLDITERKRLEEQLRQSQKMEVVGRVAGGVAHDFNNLLTVISGNVDLILEGSRDERLLRIRDAAEVGAALTRQLLAFSRQAVVKPSALDLNAAVRDMIRIVERLIGEDISIKLELTAAATVILADRGQVQQILLNLAVNARDAMADGGELTFITRETPGTLRHPCGGPAPCVELLVRDTGKGMDVRTRERAMEPFFTTKEPGKGTGLGLSTIADVVAQMKGSISIDSEPDQGTTVSIVFPRSGLAVEAASSAPASAGRGGESILLVEDNAELRELVRLFLVGAGYKVQAVGRPGEAEALWKTRGGGIDVLIADMVMPEKNGMELAKGLTAVKPTLKTLFISGYSPSRSGFGEWGFLQKPFTRIELLNAVRTLCDKPSPPSSP